MTTPHRSRPLMMALRAPVVLKYLGQIGLMLAALTAPPLAVALVDGAHAMAARFALVIAVLLLAGVPLARLPRPREIQANEALAVTALSFMGGSLAMSYPLMAADLGFLDAWFEAVSGITTTGLTTVAHVEGRPAAFLFARAWMQWYGGLGIAVLSVALFMSHHIFAKRLVQPEAGEHLSTTARTHARRTLAVYLVLTAIATLALWVSAGDGFVALTHALTAVATGGFSTFDQSLAGMAGWGPRFTVIAFCVVGGVSFPLYYAAWREGPSALLRDPELRALLAACTLAAAALTVLLVLDGRPWQDALAHGLVSGLSAQTGAGFSSLDPATLPPEAKLVTVVSMLIGASSGSTAGGIKLVRLLIVLRLLQVLVARAAAPRHAVLEPRLGGHRLEPDDIAQTLVLIMLFLAMVVVSWAVFVGHGHAPLDALFEVSSAAGTVGLSAGITGPALAPSLKVLLCLNMLAGRVEIIAMLVLLYPGTWFGRRYGES